MSVKIKIRKKSGLVTNKAERLGEVEKKNGNKDPWGTRKGTMLNKVNRILSKAKKDEPVTMAEIVEELESNDTYYNHIKKLIGKGLIKKHKGGGYYSVYKVKGK